MEERYGGLNTDHKTEIREDAIWTSSWKQFDCYEVGLPSENEH